MSRPRLVFRRRVKPLGPVHLNVSLHTVGLGVLFRAPACRLTTARQTAGVRGPARFRNASAASLAGKRYQQRYSFDAAGIQSRCVDRARGACGVAAKIGSPSR
jgi:hypothetical protein